jgi:hypothetical protein
MNGQIVDVEYEEGLVDLCKIISTQDETYTVKPLVYDAEIFLYKFSHYTHQVPIDSISGFYDTTDLTETGRFAKEGDTIYYRSLDDSDPEYEYDTDDQDESDSDSESYEDSEISLHESNEYEYE